MRKIALTSILAFAFLYVQPGAYAAKAPRLAGQEKVMWAEYGNYIRQWGIVRELLTTTVNGQPWVAFVTEGADGVVFRWDCGTAAVTLGCTSIARGESILVNGHADDRLSWDYQDGVENWSIPNGIYRCQGSTPSIMTGPCTLLTP